MCLLEEKKEDKGSCTGPTRLTNPAAGKWPKAKSHPWLLPLLLCETELAGWMWCLAMPFIAFPVFYLKVTALRRRGQQLGWENLKHPSEKCKRHESGRRCVREDADEIKLRNDRFKMAAFRWSLANARADSHQRSCPQREDGAAKSL